MIRKKAMLMCLLVSAGLAQSQLILVENLTTGTGHETIAEAIDNASSGDHLELSANTFVEHVDIDIPLTLSGAEGGGTLIDVSHQVGWGIALSADNITLEDVVILAGGTNTEYAVHSEPGITGLTIEDVAVYDSNRSCIDLNGDGLVAANDILQALSTFGVACPE